jgi:hypothetical protein
MDQRQEVLSLDKAFALAVLCDLAKTYGLLTAVGPHKYLYRRVEVFLKYAFRQGRPIESETARRSRRTSDPGLFRRVESGAVKYKTATAFRHALEERLREQSLFGRAPLARLVT